VKVSEKKEFADALDYRVPILRKVVNGIDKAIALWKDKGWCQEEDAKDKFGNGVDISSKEAAAFCWAGGLAKVGLSDYVDELSSTAIHYLGVNHNGMVAYNDAKDRKRSEVISMTKKIQGLYQFALDARSKKAA
jgi:hypothetical protein